MDGERRKRYLDRIRKGILLECVLIMAAAAVWTVGQRRSLTESRAVNNTVRSAENGYIKWVDFTVSYEALCRAYEWDVETHGTDHEVCWIDLLAYAAARSGGEFDQGALKNMEKAAKTLANGDKSLEEMTKDLKCFSYYREAYEAVLGGLVGEYREEQVDEAGKAGYEDQYGLKGYFPLARGFDYTHYDDFGVSRSYGFKRRHLGSYVIIVSSW